MTRELDEYFVKYGVGFVKVKETETYCIYSTGWGSYELFEKRVVPVTGVLKKSPKYDGYDSYVQYPSSCDFGKWAWCATTLENVEKFYLKLKRFKTSTRYAVRERSETLSPIQGTILPPRKK